MFGPACENAVVEHVQGKLCAPCVSYVSFVLSGVSGPCNVWFLQSQRYLIAICCGSKHTVSPYMYVTLAIPHWIQTPERHVANCFICFQCLLPLANTFLVILVVNCIYAVLATELYGSICPGTVLDAPI